VLVIRTLTAIGVAAKPAAAALGQALTAKAGRATGTLRAWTET